jgi:hypothetical protein
LFISFGGTTTGNIFLGIPSIWLFSGPLLPIYVFFHALVFHTPVLNPLWNFIWFYFEKQIDILVGVARGFSLVSGINNFRNHPTHATMAQSSLAGQLLIGTMSSSGSGIIYRWMMAAWNYQLQQHNGGGVSDLKPKTVMRRRVKKTDVEPVKKTKEIVLFPDPGYDVKVSCLAAFVSVCLMDQDYFTFISSALQKVSLIPMHLNSYTLPTRGEISVVSALIFIISGILRPEKE